MSERRSDKVKTGVEIGAALAGIAAAAIWLPKGITVAPFTADTVVCGRSTHLEGLTLNDDGTPNQKNATRISELKLPGDVHVKLHDPNYQAGSLANRQSQDRSDLADTNSDAVFGLGATFRLAFNNAGEVTKVQRLQELSAEQVNLACGKVVMATVQQR